MGQIKSDPGVRGMKVIAAPEGAVLVFKSIKEVEGVIEQQEPNGIYASKNTTATWIMSVDKETSQIMPLYIEGKVTVYPYPVRVDYDKNRVYKAGKPSTVINLQ